jgi:hypothetical protein
VDYEEMFRNIGVDSVQVIRNKACLQSLADSSVFRPGEPVVFMVSMDGTIPTKCYRMKDPRLVEKLALDW